MVLFLNQWKQCLLMWVWNLLPKKSKKWRLFFFWWRKKLIF